MPKRLTETKRVEIQMLHRLKWSIRQIATTVGCSTKTAQLWIKLEKHNNQEELDYKDKPGRGRKSKVTPRIVRKVVREIITKNESSLRNVASTHFVSKSTIYGIVKKTSPNDPIYPYKLRKSVFLTNTQRKKRINAYYSFKTCKKIQTK